MGNCPTCSGEMSWWGIFLVESCPGGELIWWRVVLVGNCPSGGDVLVGNCPSGESLLAQRLVMYEDVPLPGIWKI